MWFLPNWRYLFLVPKVIGICERQREREREGERGERGRDEMFVLLGPADSWAWRDGYMVTEARGRLSSWWQEELKGGPQAGWSGEWDTSVRRNTSLNFHPACGAESRDPCPHPTSAWWYPISKLLQSLSQFPTTQFSAATSLLNPLHLDRMMTFSHVPGWMCLASLVHIQKQTAMGAEDPW